MINLSIRHRILIPMIALTIGCSAAMLISSILLYNRDLINAAYEKINVASMATEHEIETFKRNSLMGAIILSSDPRLALAIKNRDRGEILSRAQNLLSMTEMEFCTITDGGGTVIARTHDPDNYGDNIMFQISVSSAVNGRTITSIERGAVVRLSVRTGIPVYDEEMNITGTVSIGHRLDTQRFAFNLKEITNCETTIFLGDERISTTILNKDGTSAIGTKAAQDISEKILAGGSYTGEFKVLDRTMICKYTPIYGWNNEAIGMLFVGNYTESDVRKVVIFVVSDLSIMLVVLVICFLLARFSSKTIENRMNNMMNQVREADLKMRDAVEAKNTLRNFENVLNGMDVMIYVTDPKTDKILFINDNMKTHYGIEGDCIGQVCYKVLQKDFNKRCEFCPCNVLDKEPEKIITWEEHSTLTNLIYRNVDRYIPWPNGQIVHMQHSIDMTELLAAKELAEQSSRFKSAFLATMSHEIRTPMNAILGITEIQLRYENLSPETEEALRKIYESGNLLLHIINDILDLSKIEAGKLELIPVEYDIPSLINDIVQINRLRYDSNPVEFKLHLEDNVPFELFGDELRIKQVLNNILSNAFKYTDKGEISLTVSAEYPPDDDKNVNIIFTVKDTGQGMTEDQVKRLFDEYSRFNVRANRTTVGAGLGMTIAKRLIDLMSGEITVKSKPLEGSVFTVLIPQKMTGTGVCSAEIISKLQSFNFQSSSLVKKTYIVHEYMPYGSVLVVDDVESNLFVAKGMLAPYGLKIDTATSGFEAVEKIKNGNVYDIIFMDHMMPKMDGIEAAQIIRKWEEEQNLPNRNQIVALTANAIVGQANEFLKNGFDGYISKPVDSRELNFILNDLIRDKKPAEVVEKARKEQKIKAINKSITIAEIKRIFVTDAERAIGVLRYINGKLLGTANSLQSRQNFYVNNSFALSEDDLQSYIISVHGMKTALANIGEAELSNIAQNLEKAGHEKNFQFLADKTSDFINALQLLAIKYKPDEKDISKEISENDQAELKEKMMIIKSACESMNKKTAKEAIAELNRREWPNQIKRFIDDISLFLLHSDFDKAAALAENTAKMKH